MTPNPTAAAKQAPRNKTDLFVSFTLLALQGFGGVLAVVQRELVEKKKWLTLDEFVEDWAVAQILPGPNVVNLSLMIGGRQFGLPGALAALAGILTVPTVLDAGGAMTVERKYSCTKGDLALALSCSRRPMGCSEGGVSGVR